MRPHFSDRRGFTLVELMTVTAIIGILTSVAIPSFRSMQARTKRAEATTVLSGIANAELGYDATSDGFVAADINPTASLGKVAHPWETSPAGWRELGFSPTGPVRCAYQVDLVSTVGFLAQAWCDVDADGNVALLQYYSPVGTTPGRWQDPYPTHF